MLPARLTSARTSCPHCNSVLLEGKPTSRGAVRAHIIAEPDTFFLWHLSRWCPRHCRRATYWCGFVTTFNPECGARGKKEKFLDLPHPTYFFVAHTSGVARSYLRRWRYRLYLHRASFQAEATLLRLLNPETRVRSREHLRQLWVRELLYRRAGEAGVADALGSHLLNEDLEALIARCWHWYQPLMLSRCLGSHACVLLSFHMSLSIWLVSAMAASHAAAKPSASAMDASHAAAQRFLQEKPGTSFIATSFATGDVVGDLTAQSTASSSAMAAAVQTQLGSFSPSPKKQAVQVGYYPSINSNVDPHKYQHVTAEERRKRDIRNAKEVRRKRRRAAGY